MTQATAPITSHHVATVDLGPRGTADVYIREAGMIDIDMPTRNGLGYTIGSNPISMAHTADQLEAGDSQGLGELTPAAMTALATALRAGIRAEATIPAHPTYSETARFDNGDHATLTVEDPNYVTVRGHLAGETIDVDLRADVADADGYLLINGNSPDALWNLPPDQARRLGHAMIGAATAARLAPEPRTPCPSWCADRHEPGHWDRRAGLWETLHVRRFGPVAVYLAHELHDDGLRWFGQCEVVLKHEDHQQQMDGESALTVGESSDLAAHLREAARFGVKLDQHLAAQAVQGVVSVDASEQGEQAER